MTAKIDIKKSSRLKLDRNGYRAERVAIVSGVTGDADAVLFNALNDAALPDIGDAHPVIDSINLQTVQSESMGGGQYRIIMSYFSDLGAEVGSSNARFTAASNTSTETIYQDINGDPMQSEYAAGTGLVSEYFPAEIEKPRLNLDFTYTSTNYPQSDIDKYSGKINSVAWLGYAVGTILCSGVYVEDDGDNYRVRFSFQHNVETWVFKAQVSYHYANISAHPVRPDPDLDLDTGIKLFDVYESVDFTPLGFTFTGPRYFAASGGAVRVTGIDAGLTVA